MSSKIYAKRKRIARAYGRRMPNNAKHPHAHITRAHQKYCQQNGHMVLSRFIRDVYDILPADYVKP